MQNPDSVSLTQLLIDAGNGNDAARNQILPQIYDEWGKAAVEAG
jgi:hypothetical protein